MQLPITLIDEILELMPDAVFLVADDGTIVRCNSVAARLFGYSKDELIDKSVEVLVPDSIREKHSEMRGEYVKKPYVRHLGSAVLMGRPKYGGEINVDIMLNPVVVGEAVYTIALIRNMDTVNKALANLQDVLKKMEGLE